ncbi:dihydropyrimidinase [Marinitoga sp. 1154]|uniref:amidohydrolase family protein n=1 Tax=Marinitoga sp. 1154 TaxID=1643335 RepID=UPI001586AC5D|nr:amidohydrolase family protein [Marinitoga sp. 1154]NUU99873.1 dihydropyrimidinase [Marinitoga sp. 1154]
MFDLAILDGKIYIDNEFIDGNIYIKNGKIKDISSSYLKSKEEYNVSGKFILPGFIDPHVHFELTVGKYTSVDNFKTGSTSAAFGGITSYIDFLDPIKNLEELEKAFEKRKILAKKSLTDYAFHATISNPTIDPEDLIVKCKELGISSIKLFTTYGSRMTGDKYISKLLKLSKEYGIVVTVHAENNELIEDLKNIPMKEHSKVRSTLSEVTEVVKLAEISEYYNGQLYIVHLSSGYSLETLKKRFKDIIGKNLVLESCPHYFYFNDEKFTQKNGYLYSMTPPLRSEEERKKLIENIKFLQTIGTDHCPFNSLEKKREYTNIMPMGIGGVEFSFSLMYTLFENEVIDKFTKNVAKYYGLYPQKGTLLPGADGDIVIFDPEKEWVIESHHSNADYTVYEDIKVKGKVITTISRGRFVIKDENLVGSRIRGRFLRREEIRW